MPTMNTGLGGTAGYGENTFSTSTKALGDNDDGAVAVDVTAVFSGGISLFGSTYSTIYINSNGAITFGTADSTFNMAGLDDFNMPALLPLFSDIDITKQGEIYWDVDPSSGKITITWDSVAAFSGPGSNSFQVVLSDLGNGEMGVEYIYEDIGWGEVSGQQAVVGVTDGAGNDYALDGSGNSPDITAYETNDFGGGDPAGTWTFATTLGVPDFLHVIGKSNSDTVDIGFTDTQGNAVLSDADFIDGGAGNDLIDGDAGNDTILGGAGSDTINSGNAAGNIGAPSWMTVNANDNFIGTTGQDYYSWTAAISSNAIVRFNNSAASGEGDNIADYVRVETTNTTGRLTIGDFDMGTDKIVLQEMYNSVTSVANSRFYDVQITYANGNTQDFRLYTDDGFFDPALVFTTTEPTVIVEDADLLLGGDGADTFVVEDQFGQDTVDGGSGGDDNDALDLSALSGPVTLTYSGGEAGTVTDGTDTLTFSDIEGATLTGGSDTFSARDFGSAVNVSGGANGDNIDGSSFADTIFGGDGADTIDTWEGNDLVYGGEGRDLVFGHNGNETIHGDAGNDLVYANNGTDLVYGGNGNDYLNGMRGSDAIYGGVGNDTLQGGDLSQSDTLDGGDDADTFEILADFGADWIIGGEGGLDEDLIDLSGLTGAVSIFYSGTEMGTLTDGTDTLNFSQIEGFAFGNHSDTLDAFIDNSSLNVDMGDGDDSVVIGDGNSAADGNTGNDSIFGGTGEDTLSGGDGNDLIDGGDGNDILKTGTGNDTLRGGSGNDTLMNAAGDDSLVGGAGDDLIVATAGNDTLEGNDGNDTLMGGTDGDSFFGGMGDDLVLGDLAGVRFNESGTDGVGLASNVTDFPDTQLTFEITFASTNTTGLPPLISYATAGEDDTFRVIAQSGSIRVEINGLEYDTTVPESGLFDGNVQTLAVTWDSATGALEVFTNGTIAHSGVFQAGETITQGGTVALAQDQDSVGGGFATDQIFDGTIYGVRIYDDVRTTSEIEASALGPVADTSDPNLIANWVADPQSASFTDQTGSHAMAVSGNATATFSAGNDTLEGFDGNDTLLGGGGDDLFYAGFDSDQFIGGDGTDTLAIDGSSVSFFDFNINLETGLDQWGNSYAEIEHYIGGSNDDIFTLADGDTTVEGMAGNDTFNVDQSDAGTKSIAGGANADTLNFSSSSEGVNVVFTGADAGTFDFAAGVNGTFSEIEEINLTNRHDTLQGWSTDETIDGNVGNDSLLGGGGNDTIFGGDGNDTLDGGAFADWLDGGAGNDQIFGGSGSDDLFWSEGADTIDGGADTDVLDTANATTTVTVTWSDSASGTASSGGFTSTFTDVEAVVVWGDGTAVGTNDVYDASGSTGGVVLLDYLGGADTITGSAFTDDLNVYGWRSLSSDGTFVDAAAGDDYVYIEEGNGTILGGDGGDTLSISGSDLTNEIYGGIGGDRIYLGGTGAGGIIDGGADNDSIVAAGDSATLLGGTGDDTLRGSNADDVFVVEDGFGSDLIEGNDGNDTLTFATVTSAVAVTLTSATAGTASDGTDTLSFSEIESISLTNQADSVDASGITSGVNFDGLDGNDTLTGGTGADTLTGGDGDDLIDGGDGNDLLTTGLGNDTLLGGAGDDTLMNSAGDDSLVGGTGNDSIVATGGNDTLEGGAGNDTLIGGIDNDVLVGGTGDDSMDGGDDADTFVLEDGFGNDTILGGEGGNDSDTIEGSALTSAVTVTFTGNEAGTVTDGSDTVTFSQIENVMTGSGDDSLDARADSIGIGLFGRAGNDTIRGGSGADYIDGGDDADAIFIEDGFGADTIFGGEGGNDNDVIDLSGMTGPATVNYTGDEAGTITDGTDTLTFSGIERIIGTDQADSIDASNDNVGTNIDARGGDDTVFGGTGDDTLDGGAGNDSITGGDGNDTISYAVGDDEVYGGNGNDNIQGSFASTDNSTLFGGAGDDTIVTYGAEETVYGDGGNDLIVGDSGNEAFYGGTGNDYIYGGLGNDTIDGGSGDDTVEAGAGNDYISESFGNDSILGEAGDDTIFGAASNDTLFGGDGNDSLHGGNNDDSVSGGAGNDTIEGGTGQDFVGGDDGNDNVSGNAGDDTVEGGLGDDTLSGGSGADSLDGGAGNDVITGGSENDTITTGTGNDTISFDRFGGDDVVTDFDLGDDDTDGFYNDQLDVSALRDLGGNPVNVGDVTVTDDGSGNARLTFPEGESIVLQGVSPAQMSSPGQLYAAGIPCFTAGTLIDTPKGRVPVEALRPGDQVITRDNGIQTIQWSAMRRLSAKELLAQPKLRPILIAPELVGADAPLLVSPQHGMLLRQQNGDEKLVRATHLARLHGGKARVAHGQRSATYVHLMFEAHQIIFANGAPSESFYPGPQALSMIGVEPLEELRSLFPSVDLTDPLAAYGDTARPFARFKDLPSKLIDLKGW